MAPDGGCLAAHAKLVHLHCPAVGPRAGVQVAGFQMK